MAKRRWFRCYQVKALHGSMGLSDEQFSVYWRLLFVMYDRGGPVPFDVEVLRHVLGKRRIDVTRIVQALVGLGKLTVSDGFIHSPAVDAELAYLAKSGANAPANDNDMDGKTNGHMPEYSAEKDSKNYARAGDRNARRATRARSETTEKKEGDGALPSRQSVAVDPLPVEVSATASATAAFALAMADALPSLTVEPEPVSDPVLVRKLIEQGTKRPRSLADIANSWKED